MPSTPQPTILIKKKDGTKERVLLSELQKRKKTKQPPKNNKIILDKKEEKVDVAGQPEQVKNTTNNAINKKKEKPPKPKPTKTTQKAPPKNNITIEAYQPPEEPNYFNEDEWEESDQSVATYEEDSVDFVDEEKEELFFENQEEVMVPAVVGEHHLAVDAPVVDAFVDQAAAQAWDQEDHQSLLEEKIELEDEKETKLPHAREDSVEGVLASLPFKIPADLKGRLSSLIQSRIKDIRSDNQVIEYAERSADMGGLGLSPENSSLLISTIQKVFHVRPTTVIPKNKKTKSDLVTSMKLPKAHPTNVAASLAQNHDSTRGGDTNQKIAKPQSKNRNPILHDVIAPSPHPEDRTISPMDELRNFSLVDFRRLSTNVDQAKEILLNKFAQLKQESFILFLKSGEAWRKSPLFQIYSTILYESISTGRTVAEVIASKGDSDSISGEEFTALASVGKVLAT